MFTVLGCVTHQHNIWLVVLAAVVCGAGAWTVMHLYRHVPDTVGLQRLGWLFLTALAAGAAVWCTHFIAVLGFEANVPVEVEPVLTAISLLVAITGTGIGFFLAASGLHRFSAEMGGCIVGLAIAAMHYSGMLAYRVEGLVSWDPSYLVASLALAVISAAIAMHFAGRPSLRGRLIATGALVFAIVGLHFTGMTAFRIMPFLLPIGVTNPGALLGLAVATAGVALIIVGAGLASSLIDDHVRAESFRQLQHMALNDILTGLPNRASFNLRLDSEIEIAAKNQSRLAVVCVDLDRFKEVNDVHGHRVGDEVLKAISQHLAASLNDEEFVARIGGDEFAAIYRERAEGKLDDFLSRLESAFSRSIALDDDSDIALRASFGVAIYPDNAIRKEDLIGNADLAMYRAKAGVAETICFYDPSMDEAFRARSRLASELKDALERGQLQVHYQVQKSLATGDVCGYEALLRWNHPVRGMVPPLDFIPLAEESGLIVEIGDWVLKTVCAAAAQWDTPYKVAVNLSAVQFAHANLAKRLHEILLETGLPAARLEMELTESTLIADKPRALHLLRQISALGVAIALDDFGAGYSSLDTLRTFTFDRIKLDRSFMSEIEASGPGRAILRAVLALGKSLAMPILAEGVETEGQLALLRTEGCDEAQGYYFGRPMTLEQLVAAGEITLRQGSDRAMDTARRSQPEAIPKRRVA